MIENQIGNFLYHYTGNVTKVYDGDTITVDIDLGLKIWIHDEKLRLARINTPEIRGEERPEGLIAQEFLENLILNKKVFIRTIKDKKGKYGRYIAEVFIEQDESLVNISDLLVDKGYAEYVEY